MRSSILLCIRINGFGIECFFAVLVVDVVGRICERLLDFGRQGWLCGVSDEDFSGSK